MEKQIGDRIAEERKKLNLTQNELAEKFMISNNAVASGFNLGDSLMVKSVDTHTLYAGDKIVFYVYSADYANFDINTCYAVKDIPQTSFKTPIESFLGNQ